MLGFGAIFSPEKYFHQSLLKVQTIPVGTNMYSSRYQLAKRRIKVIYDACFVQTAVYQKASVGLKQCSTVKNQTCSLFA